MTTTFFVRQQYLDFLNREPDTAGLAFWVNKIDSCGGNAALPRSETHRYFGGVLPFNRVSAHGTSLLPDSSGGVWNQRVRLSGARSLRQFHARYAGAAKRPGLWAADFDAQLEANKVAYFNEFVTRPEFVFKYPSALTNEQYVDNLLAIGKPDAEPKSGCSSST